MNEFWINLAFHCVLGQFAVMSIIRWAERGRFSARPANQRYQLRQPRPFLFIAMAGFVVLAGFALFGDIGRIGGNRWLSAALFGLMALSLVLIAGYCVERYHLSVRGLGYQGLLLPRGDLEWSCIDRVEYSRPMMWFVLRARDGRVLRISAMLAGVPEFARHLMQHAPGASITPAARQVLEASARGAPPTLLGSG
ncbi:MAG: hypothetical protein R3E87_18525 [Burkholderiaceae bacterium]